MVLRRFDGVIRAAKDTVVQARDYAMTVEAEDNKKAQDGLEMTTDSDEGEGGVDNNTQEAGR